MSKIKICSTCYHSKLYFWVTEKTSYPIHTFFVKPISRNFPKIYFTKKLPDPSLFGSTKTISRPITSKLNEGCLLGKVDAAAVVFSSTNPPVSIYLKDDGAMAKKNPSFGTISCSL